MQGCRIGCRQLADGVDTDARELGCGRLAHVQQVAHRLRPDQFPIVFAGKDGHSVRLLVVAAQLGKDFVERYADGYGQSQFLFDPRADGLGNGLPVSEQLPTASHVQKGFVQAHRLNLAGVVQINLAYSLGKPVVLVEMRGHDDQIGTLTPRRPQRFRRADAVLLGQRIGCQHDAVPCLLVAAHGDRLVCEGRIISNLHRSVKRVQITV